MESLIMAGQLLLSLTILVAVHEWGHYIAARMFKIRVEKFYVFFDFLFPLPGVLNFSLFKIKRGDTEFGLGWFPLGGYVKIAGMMDESNDQEALARDPEPWEYRSRPPYQRLIVLLGGIIVNVVVGIIIFVTMTYMDNYVTMESINKEGIYAYEWGESIGLKTGDKILAINGDPVVRFRDAKNPIVFFGADITIERDGQTMIITSPDTLSGQMKTSKTSLFDASNHPFTVAEVPDSVQVAETVYRPSIAKKIGMQEGDKILKVNDDEILVFGDVKQSFVNHLGKDVVVTVERDGQSIELPKAQLDSVYPILGFTSNKVAFDTVDYTFGQAVSYGTSDAFNIVIVNAVGIGQMFTGKVNVMESLQGPVGIAKNFGPTWDWWRFWKMTGLLSMILAFMNLLPIPALDGGQVVVTLIEWAIGRELPLKVQSAIQTVGMIIILGLMVLAFVIDLS